MPRIAGGVAGVVAVVGYEPMDVCERCWTHGYMVHDGMLVNGQGGLMLVKWLLDDGLLMSNV